jgi:hypothetical protein
MSTDWHCIFRAAVEIGMAGLSTSLVDDAKRMV